MENLENLSEEEIIEGNKIIAEYHSQSHLPDKSMFFYEGDELKEFVEKIGKTNVAAKDLQYHKSHDWLMAACRKHDDANDFRPEYIEFCDKIDNAVTRFYTLSEPWTALIESLKWLKEN